MAPVDETGHAPTDDSSAESPTETPGGATPTDTLAGAPEVAGESGGGQDTPTGDLAVQVAYCHSSRVSHSWHTSMMNMIGYDKTLGSNLIRQMPFAVSCSGPNSLVEGRNLAAKHFLDETDSGWLFMVDTDMGFRPDAVEQLWFAAMAGRPVVGGLCFAMKHMGSDGKGGQRVMPVPTLFMFAKNENQGVGFANRFIYPPDSLVQVAGTGAAFLLIHRSVLEGMRAKYGDHWFDFVQYGDGAQVSEDLSFCWRVNELGFPIFVDTRIKVTHHKEMWLGETDYTMPPTEPMQTMMDAAKEGAPHLTCLDISTMGEKPETRFVCGPACPKVDEEDSIDGPERTDCPEGMDPAIWATFNRQERRQWRGGKDRRHA